MAEHREHEVFQLKTQGAKALNETNRLLEQLKSTATATATATVVLDHTELFRSSDSDAVILVEVEAWRNMLRRLREEFESCSPSR